VGFLGESAAGWNGSQYEVLNWYATLGHGAYADLQFDIGTNGYLSQIVNLPLDGNCTLSFLQQVKNTNYADFVMEVLWNG
jgi:hypothetical protein